MKLKVLCLVTSVRGGSKLFQSLLDDHPEIIGFPRTFRLTSFLRRINNKINDTENISNAFIKHYPLFFDGTIWKIVNKLDKADQLGEKRNETFKVSQDKFKNAFLELYNANAKNVKNLFVSLNCAFQIAKRGYVPEKFIILYHIHDISFVDDVELCVSLYGVENVKVVFTTRHPVDGLNSVFQWMEIQNYLTPVFNNPKSYAKQTYVFTSELSKAIPEIDLRVVLLEVIKAYRREVMESLCKFIGISWNNSLMKSTLMGKKWLGNAQAEKGDKKERLQWFKHSSWLEKKDLQIYVTLFPDRMKMFGPDQGESIGNLRRLKFLIVFPMAVEFKIFIKSLSLFYWYKCIERTIKELTSQDPIYNYKNRGPYGKLQYLYMKFRSGNVITCFIAYVRRVSYLMSIVGKKKIAEKRDLLFSPIENACDRSLQKI